MALPTLASKKNEMNSANLEDLAVHPEDVGRRARFGQVSSWVARNEGGTQARTVVVVVGGGALFQTCFPNNFRRQLCAGISSSN